MLQLDERAALLRSVGRRFATVTMAVFLPSQIGTGVLLAWRHGVNWQSLAEPGYSRVLLAKLTLFALVMIASSLHGVAQARGRSRLARGSSVAALTGSVGVVLLATGLVSG